MLPSFSGYTLVDFLIGIIDIILVWVVLYRLLQVVRGTTAIQVLKGIIIIIVVKGLSNYMGFHTLEWITDQVMIWGFLTIVIIFQPEIRRALEQLGRAKFFSSSSFKKEDKTVKNIESIIEAMNYMAKRRIGALISIEKEINLHEYIETGIPIGGEISSQLLINIFIPNTPLHDGAVILTNHQIAAAGCYLPLSESPTISKELGTRHRAAIGISEVTDCVTLIVSEETGSISLTKNRELHRDITLEELKVLLEQELINSVKDTNKSTWKWGFKKNG